MNDLLTYKEVVSFIHDHLLKAVDEVQLSMQQVFLNTKNVDGRPYFEKADLEAVLAGLDNVRDKSTKLAAFAATHGGTDDDDE